jgi:catechol 2,3-dioxygenase-like lactoylglutathione lyase family enzyme
MPALSINHVSVHALDLSESTDFYVELFGMEPIPTPDFGFPVQWLRLGSQQLHLFVRDGASAPPYHHLGINVEDFHALLRKLRARQLADGRAFAASLNELPDGAVQLYLHDPAGNLVEVDWPDARTLDPAIVGQIPRLADRIPQRGQHARATLFHG